MSFTLLYSLFFLHRLLMVQAVLHARLALQSPWQYSDSSHEFHTIVSTHSKLSIYLDLAIEGLGAGGEGDDRRWDGWMASPTRCTWVWVNSWSWWWTGRPGVLWFLGSDTTEWLNWTELEHSLALPFFGIGMKTDLFQSCGYCWVFQICWHIECSTLTASSFKTWNSSAGFHHLH